MAHIDSKNAAIAKAAYLYYERGKTQREIAHEMGITRVAVSRILAEARTKGIVKIKVEYPWTSKRLERRLVETFGLDDAKVLYTSTSSSDEIIEEIGIIAAKYFMQIAEDGQIIGISWGRALHRMIDALQHVNMPAATIVQLIGASGTEAVLTDGPKLAQHFSEKLGCTAKYMHSPLIVENETIKNSLIRDRMLNSTIELAQKADLAFVGIGATEKEIYSLLKTGYVDEQEFTELKKAGVVGDICAQHFDINGKILDIPLNKRTIGINLDQLSGIGTVIGVAGDPLKSRAIHGALKGGYLDVLITDFHVAKDVLALSGEKI